MLFLVTKVHKVSASVSGLCFDCSFADALYFFAYYCSGSRGHHWREGLIKPCNSSQAALTSCLMMMPSCMQVFDRLVAEAGKRGILVMLDCHHLSIAGGITELWHDSTTSEAQLIQAWTTIVGRYRSAWNVFAGKLTWVDPCAPERQYLNPPPCLKMSVFNPYHVPTAQFQEILPVMWLQTALVLSSISLPLHAFLLATFPALVYCNPPMLGQSGAVEAAMSPSRHLLHPHTLMPSVSC